MRRYSHGTGTGRIILGIMRICMVGFIQKIGRISMQSRAGLLLIINCIRGINDKLVLSFTVRITGVDEIIFSNNNVRSRMPMTKRTINQDLANTFIKGAIPRIHRITGKTGGSTRIVQISEQSAIIESRFGAFYEERRKGTKFGTPHNFITQQLIAMDSQIYGIVNNRLTPLFGF